LQLPTRGHADLREHFAEVPLHSARAFDPIFVYVALALSGVIAVARLLLGWAMRD
jgi:hypothetical protein